MIAVPPALLRIHQALLVLGGAGLVSLSFAEPAASDPQPFRVTFSTAAGCGSAAAFEDEVLKRTDRLRLADSDEAALALNVELTRAAQGIEGRLTLRESDGHVTEREVPGGDCEEVLSAMALIAALTVDPLARPDREIPLARRQRNRRESQSPAPPRPTRQSPKRVIPKRELPKQGEEPAPPSPAEPANAEPGIGFGVGQRVTLQTAVMPGTTLGLGAHAELAVTGPSLWSPRVRLSGIFSRSGAIDAERGRAEFDWITARLQGCPVRLGFDRTWNIRPCAYLDAGRLHGVGSQIEPNDQKSVFWTAAGVELSGELRLFGPLALGAELGILLPFRRDRFLFEPDTELHEVPAAGFSGAVGLGLLFF
ncbi:MAG: hypothetical protein M3020_21925 [Myxococcota bacterium]|nr:hypothetical protein [Myxococcota bacterium]